MARSPLRIAAMALIWHAVLLVSGAASALSHMHRGCQLAAQPSHAFIITPNTIHGLRHASPFGQLFHESTRTPGKSSVTTVADWERLLGRLALDVALRRYWGWGVWWRLYHTMIQHPRLTQLTQQHTAIGQRRTGPSVTVTRRPTYGAVLFRQPHMGPLSVASTDTYTHCHLVDRSSSSSLRRSGLYVNGMRVADMHHVRVPMKQASDTGDSAPITPTTPTPATADISSASAALVASSCTVSASLASVLAPTSSSPSLSSSAAVAPPAAEAAYPPTSASRAPSASSSFSSSPSASAASACDSGVLGLDLVGEFSISKPAYLHITHPTPHTHSSTYAPQAHTTARHTAHPKHTHSSPQLWVTQFSMTRPGSVCGIDLFSNGPFFTNRGSSSKKHDAAPTTRHLSSTAYGASSTNCGTVPTPTSQSSARANQQGATFGMPKTTVGSSFNWPNEVCEVAPGTVMNAAENSLLVADGFLIPGRSDGGIFLVQDPGKPQERVACLTRRRCAWFYHKAVWVDLMGDGRKCILTARATRPFFGRPEGELVMVMQPDSPYPLAPWNLPWQEKVLVKGPDVMFDVVDLDPQDDTIEVFAAEFFSQRLTMHRIRKGDWRCGRMPEVVSSQVIDDSLGVTYSVVSADLTGSDKPSHILVSTHECRYDLSSPNKGHATPPSADDDNADTDSLPLIGGSLFAYRIPSDWHNKARGSSIWRRSVIATGFQVRSLGQIGPGAPGFAYVFHPHTSMQRQHQRPYILVAGDCSHAAYIYRPVDNAKGNNPKYKLMAEIQCGGTVGSIAVAHIPLFGEEAVHDLNSGRGSGHGGGADAADGDGGGGGEVTKGAEGGGGWGWAKIFVPNFDKDKVYVFAFKPQTHTHIPDGHPKMMAGDTPHVVSGTRGLSSTQKAPLSAGGGNVYEPWMKLTGCVDCNRLEDTQRLRLFGRSSWYGRDLAAC